MTIVKAKLFDLPTVKEITVNTISEIYPHYYPKGAVEFFLKHHNETSIKNDIELDSVYLCIDSEKTAVGTVTIKGNALCRLFVLPHYQGNGYGRAMLDFAEKTVAKQYGEIVLDSSLPAKGIYRKRGYTEVDSHVIKASNGDFLCYDVMIKLL